MVGVRRCTFPASFLKMGTSVDPDLATVPSVSTAYVLDMTQPSPAWRQVASMAFARTYHNYDSSSGWYRPGDGRWHDN